MRKSPKTIAQAIVRSFQVKEAAPMSRLIEDLDRFYEAVRQTKYFKALKGILTKPAEKRAILQKTLPMLPLGVECQAVLMALADRNQMADLPRVVAALKEIRLKKFKVEEAEVITVKPLTQEQKGRASKTLSKMSGSEILIREKVNPAILGGLVLKLQDSVIDASLIRKIVEMKKRLTA
jgi:ATP synthase F1 delta subunit